ncbi:phosphodiesterase [Burkholderia sp. PAMC 28687]|uniref:metallophosphoesterase family protein n=1 Tax=Burkholderia sp. PAMC 28687 TaxID=1795874 RepID=UPI0007861A5B|nr:metallophosphoesterase family protein [Burkholderia sp. PAMC 28687]AMM13546.1 phosphodiesterase [Burkholderia sp. PAMC 28687]
MSSNAIRIGVISDTHNLVRPEALHALQSCEHIIHAGDICNPAVLDALNALAPVTAVRGNNDSGVQIDDLPEAVTLRLGETSIHVVHDIADVPRRLDGVDVVITGHSHKPLVERRGATLFVNPGSAGPRRFKLPITLGIMVIESGEVKVEIVTLVE